MEAHFSTEAASREYLSRLRWPDGFYCPRCGGRKTCPLRDMLPECPSCGYQCSVTAGTIFQDTRKALTLRFRAIWWVTSQKNVAGAMGLQGILGLGSYKTAWTWLHTLRRAMVRPGRDRLSGTIEVDETYLVGNLTYHAAQVRFERRFAGGFAYEKAYTFGKSIDDSSAISIDGSKPPLSQCRNRSLSATPRGQNRIPGNPEPSA